MNEKKQPQQNGKMLAIIRLRGRVKVEQVIADTLTMLRIHKKNACVVVQDTPSNRGMINKVKDHITWGEIDDETLKALIEKRSEPNPKDPKKTKAFFRLNNPRGGFERKGVKISYSDGGALGYRGPKINDLIKRMIQ